ncbi:tyrosine-type recombinase/integrase [Chloroflexota bacterium]
MDRKANGVASGTLCFYRIKLLKFTEFCEGRAIKQIDQITPTFIREYLLYLQDNGHNPADRHAYYRALRAFFLWYENEVELIEWSNPIRKVKGTKIPTEPLEPVSYDTVARMMKVCESGTFTGERDKALMLSLLDTGARANELLSMNKDDLNQATGIILIKRGKGSKPRQVYLGKKTKRALRKYLRTRSDNNPAVWVTHPRYGSERLGYDGLRTILSRRADSAQVSAPTLHSFRRAFALTMLRNGTDLYTLAALMGHEGITVLQRYLKQTYEDTELANRKVGPVDNIVQVSFV